MNKITLVDTSCHALDIHRDLSVSARLRKPGPPERIDGMTVGVVTVLQGDAPPPHKGEVHPDGDEIVYVISGRLRVTGESEPTTAASEHKTRYMTPPSGPETSQQRPDI